MAKNKPLKAVSYVRIDGELVRFDSLSEAKRNEIVDKMMENVGRALSMYFSAHPEEALPLLDPNDPETVIIGYPDYAPKSP